MCVSVCLCLYTKYTASSKGSLFCADFVNSALFHFMSERSGFFKSRKKYWPCQMKRCLAHSVEQTKTMMTKTLFIYRLAFGPKVGAEGWILIFSLEHVMFSICHKIWSEAEWEWDWQKWWKANTQYTKYRLFTMAITNDHDVKAEDNDDDDDNTNGKIDRWEASRCALSMVIC